VTVTSDRFVVMLQEFLYEELFQQRVNMRLLLLKQDGGTAHTARNSMQTVQEMFPERVLSFRRHSVTSAVTGFISMRLLPVGLFEAKGVCE
jgi:hypothetical protein